MQTVKQCMNTCLAAGQDPDLAMLVYRATPLTSSIPSPAKLLNGRKYRALLPARSLVQSAHGQIVREQMVENKNKTSMLYNKAAKDLPLLTQHRSVYVQPDTRCNRLMPATITKTPTASQPRSYSVETLDGTHLVRNRRFISPVDQPSQATVRTPNVPVDRSSVDERPRRVINKPKRLIETI